MQARVGTFVMPPGSVDETIRLQREVIAPAAREVSRVPY